jgi:2-haloacid dehalogenase|tara:strand:+ start:667 stop:1272 length:606 start_codon:yes stop_codon:yes gene_type:complete
MKIEKVIFDLGKVLVKFNPKNPFKNIFKSEDEINFFFKNICTWEWHVNQDTTYDTRPATDKKIKEHPEFREAISAFYGRFQEMIVGVYDQNLSIALELKKRNIPIYILSNFPGDQFDIFESNYAFIKKFDDMVISGKVGMKKPDPKIYKLCISKFNCDPNKTLFIDDRPENTKAAEIEGFQTITLDHPDRLSEYIKKFNLI